MQTFPEVELKANSGGRRRTVWAFLGKPLLPQPMMPSLGLRSIKNNNNGQLQPTLQELSYYCLYANSNFSYLTRFQRFFVLYCKKLEDFHMQLAAHAVYLALSGFCS